MAIVSAKNRTLPVAVLAPRAGTSVGKLERLQARAWAEGRVRVRSGLAMARPLRFGRCCGSTGVPVVPLVTPVFSELVASSDRLVGEDDCV